MTYMTAAQKPDWLKRADRRVDMSDVWMEQTDPTAERGEVCDKGADGEWWAIFETEECRIQNILDLAKMLGREKQI